MKGGGSEGGEQGAGGIDGGRKGTWPQREQERGQLSQSTVIAQCSAVMLVGHHASFTHAAPIGELGGVGGCSLHSSQLLWQIALRPNPN